jgi:hypothetical protein
MTGMRFSVRDLFLWTTVAAVLAWLAVNYPVAAVVIVGVFVLPIAVSYLMFSVPIAILTALAWLAEHMTGPSKRR